MASDDDDASQTSSSSTSTSNPSADEGIFSRFKNFFMIFEVVLFCFSVLVFPLLIVGSDFFCTP